MKKILKSALHGIKKLLKCLILLAIIFSAPSAHHVFLKNVIGGQVVKIVGGSSGGTGFHIQAPSGKVYIMTNNHICDAADKEGNLKIYVKEKFISVRKVIKRYDSHDLCLVEPLDGKAGLILSALDSTPLPSYVVGHPLNQMLSIQSGRFVGKERIDILGNTVVTKKECSEKAFLIPDLIFRMFTGLNYYCIKTYTSNTYNLIIYNGNSGSPVISPIGTVLGVIFAGDDRSVTSAHAVPLSYIRDLLKDY